jgi:hypothetical protein
LRSLTAITHEEDAASTVTKLPAGAILTVAGTLRGSAFVQVTCDTVLHDVAAEDLEEAAARSN